MRASCATSESTLVGFALQFDSAFPKTDRSSCKGPSSVAVFRGAEEGEGPGQPLLHLSICGRGSTRVSSTPEGLKPPEAPL